MAATLVVPAGAISGAAAAALHGMPGWKPGVIEVVTRHGTTHDSPFGPVRESRTVGRLTVVHGIRVVSKADCLIQLASHVDDPMAYSRLVDDVARTDRRVLPEFRDRFVSVAHSRLAGIGTVRAAIEARGPGYVPPASELDRRFRLFMGAAPLPGVEHEMTPPWVVPGAQRVDAVVVAWRLIVEADGRDWHTRVLDFERDRERDAVALAHGYATLRLTWHQLVNRSTWCRNILVAIGAQRSGQGGDEAATWTGSTSSGLIVVERSGQGGRGVAA